MYKENLKNKLFENINAGSSLSDLRKIIISFKEQGGKQEDAYLILNELRQFFLNNEEKHDIILDSLDFVVGFCSAHLRIWDTILKT